MDASATTAKPARPAFGREPAGEGPVSVHGGAFLRRVLGSHPIGHEIPDKEPLSIPVTPFRPHT